ncbi:MAG: DUF523 domain-containing protein [Proteobacteria bacterium]|nr:DUF523 domain-containing protein [Pseudomonadota bacterium]
MSLNFNKKRRILISACLIGDNVRYNQIPLNMSSAILLFLYSKNLLYPLCPELEGGLTVPRSPAEIQKGNEVNQTNPVIVVKNNRGEDVSTEFSKGADRAVQSCIEQGCKMAILKERSPSCGVNHIYDGSFSDEVVPGIGVTSRLLRERGVVVFSENQLSLAYSFWFHNY